jgi:hypothetical protein
MADQLAKRERPIHHLVLLDPPTHGGSLGRAGALGLLPPPRKWMDAVIESLLPATVVRRRRESKYRKLLTRKMLNDPRQRAEWAHLPFSTVPRARLSAAYSVYRPKPYRGSVTLLSSQAQDSAFQAGSNLAKLLPQLCIELVANTHSDIDNPEVGRAMQRAFDAALGLEGSGGRSDRSSTSE